ncbi:MAG TPA: TonB-dependent receptor [Vicinamibacterales bacterium]|nr:TonB-dependent receptor [Vicinamibacterales bacterium]
MTVSGVLLASAPAPALAAPSVRGIVIDASGGERLARVRIRIEGTGQATVTNEVGEFTFDDLAAGEHTLIAETVGYRLHREQIMTFTDHATEIVVALTGDSVRLTETVTVTVDPFASVVPASPSQTRIGAAEIRNLSSVLLDDPMRSISILPGVTAPDDYHAAFSVRGAPFAHVGVYLDDVPLRAPTHTFGGLGDGYSISSLNDQMLGSMTLMPAAPPPAFGGTIGAAMAVDTRDGSRDRTSVHASVGVSDINVLGEGPIGGDKRGSWLVAGRKSHLAYVTKQLAGNDDEKVMFEDVQGKLTYDVDSRNSVSMHVLAGTSSYKSGIQEIDPAFPFRFGPDTVFNSDGSTAVVRANWRYSPAATVTINTTAAYQRTHDEALSTSDTPAVSSRYSDVSAQTTASWLWKPAMPLRAGFASRSGSQSGTSYLSLLENVRWRSANAYDGTAHSQNAYVEQDWISKSGRLHLTGGLRWQQHSEVDDRPVLPFVSSSFDLGAQSKIEVGWGRYAQFPEIDMLQLARSDRPLLDERSTHYVAAFEHRVDAHTRIRIEAYDRENRNVLDAPDVYPRLVGGSVTWPASAPKWTNAYDGHSRGLELIVQRRSASRVSGWIGYTLAYNRSQDLATGTWFDSDGDVRHALNLYATYRITPSINLSGRYGYAAGAPIPGFFSITDFVTEDSVVTEPRNVSRLPSYQRLDVRLNKSFVHDKWKMTMYAEALNATNHRNLRYMGIGGDYISHAWARLGSTAPLLPSVGLAVDF